MRTGHEFAQQFPRSDLNLQDVCRTVRSDQEVLAVEGGSGSDVHPSSLKLGKVSLTDVLRPNKLIGVLVEGVQHPVP